MHRPAEKVLRLLPPDGTCDGLFGKSIRSVELSLTLLEDHARFSGVLNFLLLYSEKNARELLKVLVEKVELQEEGERLR